MSRLDINEALKRSVLTHFYQINRRIRRQVAGNIGVEHLTMHQMQALLFVKTQQTVRMRELADELQISPGSATLLADRLVDSGWLVRHPDPTDRRIISLALSKEAAKKFVELMDVRMQHAGQMLDKLTADDLVALDRILAKIEES